MTKEIGPRERALRQQREEAFEASQKATREADRKMLDTMKKLRGDVAEASKKRGKPRKKK